MSVSARSVLGFALLPGVGPMIRDLGGSGFSQVAFFMALILHSAGLLPAGHPYVRSANIGRFGVRHVLAESARALKFDRQHIDQIIIFGVLLTGIVILLLQCVLLLISLCFEPALAAMPTNYGQFFVTTQPKNDIAFILLDRVFGVKDMFNSCVAQAIPCMDNTRPDGPFPSAYHFGLHAMLRLYSIALMVIAVLIFCYFIVTMIAETAQDGTPFGRRFNHVWAPIRMVVALGLLVPIGTTGLNSAQYVTLIAAKWGSGFATNAWTLFNTTLTGTYLGEKEKLVASPKIPELDRMMQFMLTARACQHAYEYIYTDNPVPYVVRDPLASPNHMPYLGSTWQDAIRFTNGQNIVIHIGVHNASKYPIWKGNVMPICGSFTFPVVDLDEPGAQDMLAFYYSFFQRMYESFDQDGDIIARRNIQQFNESRKAPIETDRLKRMEDWYKEMTDAVTAAVKKQEQGADFANAQMLQYGWAGASVWYNKIAQMNGAVTTAVFNIPKPKRMTALFEKVLDQKQARNSTFSVKDMFNRVKSGKDTMDWLGSAEDGYIFSAEYDAYKIYEDSDSGTLRESYMTETGNVIIDTINYIFGTSGLFNIRQNADIHPLAQLSAVGKSLIESTIRNIAYALGIGAFNTIVDSGILKILSGLALTFAMVGLTAGFALFYVIPFLPFLYFFFSVGGWVKGIFEAMVGVPLWALAHIRIDGQGLPGDAAANGYYLIFEVFLRPILMLFGLLGSILVFAAAVRVLNDIWDLVVSNVSGFDIRQQANATYTDIAYYRGPVDEFFFMVIYTIMVYMLGVSSFKMVYLVPNQILRWMGANVSTFGDHSQDPTSGLMQTVAIGGGSVSGQLSGASRQLGTAGQEAIKKIMGRGG